MSHRVERSVWIHAALIVLLFLAVTLVALRFSAERSEAKSPVPPGSPRTET